LEFYHPKPTARKKKPWVSPKKKQKQKQNKPWVFGETRRDPVRLDPLRDLPLPSSLLFFFSLFFNQLQHGLKFFGVFFSSVGEVLACD
jgi:hypothetical protein